MAPAEFGQRVFIHRSHLALSLHQAPLCLTSPRAGELTALPRLMALVRDPGPGVMGRLWDAHQESLGRKVNLITFINLWYLMGFI